MATKVNYVLTKVAELEAARVTIHKDPIQISYGDIVLYRDDKAYYIQSKVFGPKYEQFPSLQLGFPSTGEALSNAQGTIMVNGVFDIQNFKKKEAKLYYQDESRVVILEFGEQSARKAVLLEFENASDAGNFATKEFSECGPKPVVEHTDEHAGSGAGSGEAFRITLSVRD